MNFKEIFSSADYMLCLQDLYEKRLTDKEYISRDKKLKFNIKIELFENKVMLSYRADYKLSGFMRGCSFENVDSYSEICSRVENLIGEVV